MNPRYEIINTLPKYLCEFVRCLVYWCCNKGDRQGFYCDSETQTARS